MRIFNINRIMIIIAIMDNITSLQKKKSRFTRTIIKMNFTDSHIKILTTNNLDSFNNRNNYSKHSNKIDINIIAN